MTPVQLPEVPASVMAAAYDPIIVRNSLTRPGGYSPYCMRCVGMHRMTQVGVLHWKHHCGAEHDEREARIALAATTPSETNSER